MSIFFGSRAPLLVEPRLLYKEKLYGAMLIAGAELRRAHGEWPHLATLLG